MKRIVLIEKDPRTIRDIRSWVRDLNDEVQLKEYVSEEDFFEDFLAEKEEEEEDPKAKKSEDSENPEGTEEENRNWIDLIIIDRNLAGKDPIAWIQKYRELIKEKGLFPEEGRTKFVVLAFDSLDLKIDRLAHPFVDDLFIKPLDRVLILQKMELLLGGDTDASFLYTQKTNSTIQMAKTIEIVALSEYGFAITNPVSLKNGTFMTAHSPLFESNKSTSIIGRCHKVVRSPKYPSGFLCYFTYFGVTSGQMKNLRKKLNSFPAFKSAATGMEDSEEIVPSNPTKHIAVIEMSTSISSSLVELLGSRFPNIKCHTFPNYSQFLKRIAPPEEDGSKGGAGGEPQKELQLGIDADDAAKGREAVGEKEEVVSTQQVVEDNKPQVPFAYVDKFSLELLKDQYSIREINPAPSKSQKIEILGYTKNELVEEDFEWKCLFPENVHDDIDEFIQYIESGQKAEMTTFTQYKEEDVRFKVKLTGTQKTTTLKIDFEKQEATANEDHLEDEYSREELAEIECIVINGNFVRGELGPWIESLREDLNKHLGISPEKEIPLILLGEENTKVKPEFFTDHRILSFWSLPLDRRIAMQQLAALIPFLSYKKTGIYLGDVDTRIHAKVAQNVMMKEISEYGIAIQYHNPLKENIFLSFFSPIFGPQAEGVLAKCYGFEGSKAEDGGYLCYFTFFGVTDTLLKKIRSWIKEEYVATKDGKE